jgi:hypothetical protein
MHGKPLDKPIGFDMANLLYKQTYKQVLSKLLDKPLRCVMASLDKPSSWCMANPCMQNSTFFTPAWHLMGICTCNLYSCVVKLIRGVIVISLVEVLILDK